MSTYLSTTTEGYEHATFFQNGQVIDLGVLGGYTSGGLGVNARGQIVGFGGNATNLQVAIIFISGQAYDLNTLADLGGTGWVNLSHASRINEAGQIIGGGRAA
jgi:uncharacterized membrane protein